MNWLRKFWRVNKPAPVKAPPIPVAPQVLSTEPVAFISDVHGNLKALKAVLADIEARGVREIVCLGDIVGYGGSAAECVKLIRDAGFPCIRGNHDAYAGNTTPLPARGPDFELAFERIREQVGEEGCHWLGNLPLTYTGEDFEAVHASLYHSENWPYILIAPGAEIHFANQIKPVCFVGHTHQPKMWIEGMERPVDGGIGKIRPDRKHVVDVGSVGKPRDDDERSCYVIYRRKDREVWWRRVAYDH